MFEFVDMYFVKYHALTFNLFLTNEVDNTGFVRVFSLGTQRVHGYFTLPVDTLGGGVPNEYADALRKR